MIRSDKILLKHSQIISKVHVSLTEYNDHTVVSWDENKGRWGGDIPLEEFYRAALFKIAVGESFW